MLWVVRVRFEAPNFINSRCRDVEHEQLPWLKTEEYENEGHIWFLKGRSNHGHRFERLYDHGTAETGVESSV